MKTVYGKRCPVCELVLAPPKPAKFQEYIDEPHKDIKDCMLVITGDLRQTISRLEDELFDLKRRLHDISL